MNASKPWLLVGLDLRPLRMGLQFASPECKQFEVLVPKSARLFLPVLQGFTLLCFVWKMFASIGGTGRVSC